MKLYEMIAKKWKLFLNETNTFWNEIKSFEMNWKKFRNEMTSNEKKFCNEMTKKVLKWNDMNWKKFWNEMKWIEKS